MKLTEAFPGKYLKCDDLDGREIRMVMDYVEMKEMQGQDGEKPVLYFENQTRGLVLNKTNAGTIADVYGGEMDDWGGHPIVLFPTKTQFGSKTVDCIRVRVPELEPATEAKPETTLQLALEPALPADGIPF